MNNFLLFNILKQILLYIPPILFILYLIIFDLKKIKYIFTLSLKIGFTQGFIIWILIGISEWRNYYEIKEILFIILVSSLAGLAVCVAYFISGIIVYYFKYHFIPLLILKMKKILKK